MPTTRSASNAKKPSAAAKVDAGSSESGEGSRSRLLDAGELDDDLQVCPSHVGQSCEIKGNLSEPPFRSVSGDSESREESGRFAS
jgi:hypothetical protein